LTNLKLSGNLLTSVDLAGMVLSYGASTSYVPYGSDFQNNLLSAQALNDMFGSLGEDLSANGTLLVGGNPGSATCDPTIATALGYTVVGV